MKSDQEIMRSIRAAIDDCTQGINEAPSLQYRIARKARGEEPVVKKVSTTVVIVLVLLALAVTAVAAGIIYNQNWYYNNRGSSMRDNQPEVYEAVMANMTENPEQNQSVNELVNVTIEEVSWAPEAEKLTVSWKVFPKDPEKFEVHGMLALDEDGCYMGDEGSADVTEDGEDRAMHWLWRVREVNDDDEDEEGSMYGILYGPPAQMMDDGSKRLLLVDRKGISMFDGALDAFGSWDVFRTPDGNLMFIEEIKLDWLSEDFDAKKEEYAEEYPDMADYAEKLTAGAKAAREKLKDGSFPCTLTYSVVEYVEGMDDETLYSGGEEGTVEFVVETKGK